MCACYFFLAFSPAQWLVFFKKKTRMPVVDNGFFSRPLNFFGGGLFGKLPERSSCAATKCAVGGVSFFAEFGPIFISSSFRGAISTAGAATWKMNKSFQTLLCFFKKIKQEIGRN